METLRELWRSIDFGSMGAFALRLVMIFLCLTIHETSHGLAAYALGDPTAKERHRLSLNPLHHIDWLGFAAMLFLGFGWAKPVPVDMRYFKDPKRGMALTALAGPVSNMLLAVLMLLLAKGLGQWVGLGERWSYAAFLFCLSTAQLSVGLGVFNLIPLPPLDGSKIFFSLLPERAYYTLMRYERLGMIALYLLIFLGALDNFLGDAISAVFHAMVDLIF